MADNSHSTSSGETSSEWGPCPAGTVGRLVGKLKHRRRVRRVKQAAVAASGLLILIVAGRSLLTTGTPPQAFSHAEVDRLAGQFVRGELDEEQTRRVEAHIKVCPQCHHLLKDRQAYQQQQGAQLPVPNRDDSKLVARSH